MLLFSLWLRKKAIEYITFVIGQQILKTVIGKDTNNFIYFLIGTSKVKKKKKVENGQYIYFMCRAVSVQLGKKNYPHIKRYFNFFINGPYIELNSNIFS